MTIIIIILLKSHINIIINNIVKLYEDTKLYKDIKLYKEEK